MTIAIIARERYCARVLEALNGTNLSYEHTGMKHFNMNEIAVFRASGNEEDIIFMEKLIKGEFLNDDVTTLRFITDKYPMLDNPQ